MRLRLLGQSNEALAEISNVAIAALLDEDLRWWRHRPTMDYTSDDIRLRKKF